MSALLLQEAASCGVRDLSEARNVLKVMQTLETAMQSARTSPNPHSKQLYDRIKTAKKHKLDPHLLTAAEALHHSLQLQEVSVQLAILINCHYQIPKRQKSTQAICFFGNIR